jgi:hypothetical protein
MLAQTDDLRLTTSLEQPDQSSPLGGSIHSAGRRAGAWRAAPRQSSGSDRNGYAKEFADPLRDRVHPVRHRVSLCVAHMAPKVRARRKSALEQAL